MKITIPDPAFRCSTGICGPEVDDNLVQTAADVRWLKSLRVEVARHNISKDGEGFQQFSEAVEKLKMDGLNSLPFILKDGKIIMSGRYPDKFEWEALLKSTPVAQAQTQNNSCCSRSSCC